MNKVWMLLVLAAAFASFPPRALSKTITIAVIDTGVDRGSNDKLCKFGHKNFSNDQSDPLEDFHGHGTHIAGLIRREAGLLDYCIVSIKYFNEGQTGKQNLIALRKAIKFAINIRVDFINISGGGPESDDEEMVLIKRALDRGIKVVVAAGNERSNLNERCDYFPACYDKRLIVVANGEIDRTRTSWVNGNPLEIIGPVGIFRRQPSSNYGSIVTRWEMGTNVDSTLPNGKRGHMTGTSQATGIATGKMIREQLQIKSE